MTTLSQCFSNLRRWMSIALLALLACTSFALPAQAERYVTPEGEDITEIVNCIPERLAKGDLQRAIAESGKDYLERVFQTKDSYGEYEISEAEKEYQACLQRKGITPMAKQNQLG
ncbi:MAG: hypothetical protein F6J97_06945 [Leptolyngbya sp. SIO4C1]|nr:hypothetical protein [Leptolyngbya sp. SIO4C1]